MAAEEQNPPSKRKGKWGDPEYVRKYNREWRRRRKKKSKVVKRKAKKPKKDSRYDDAIIYLRQAVARMDHDNESWPDLLTKLALKTLEGG